MKKFIVTYHAPATWNKAKKSTPEDMKKGVEQWMTWAKRCGKGLVDMGSPLGNSQKLSKTGSTPSKREIVGYSVLQAENMKEACEMLKGHPHFAWADGCEIEVHESMPMPK